MAVPGADQVGKRALEELVQTASQQAVVLAREQLDVARRELAARARQAGPGVAMVGGGAVLAALASGTGTTGLILLLARRGRASAAALGVTGAYAGAGAIMIRGGVARLRELGPSKPEAPVHEEPVQRVKRDAKSARRQTSSAAKTASAAASPQRIKSATKSPVKASDRGTAASKTGSSRRRPSGAPAARMRGRRA